MKPIELDNTSIHYKLAVIGGLSKYAQSTDICSYTRNVFFGILLIAALTVASTFLSWVLIHTILGVAFSLYNWTFMFTEPGKAGLIVTSIMLAWFSIWAVITFTGRLAKRSQDSFLVESFQSWKGKYCAPVTIKGVERDYDY